MNVLPYAHFTIRTSLTPDEVFNRVASVTEDYRLFGWPESSDHRPYEGDVYIHVFNISRIVHGFTRREPRVRISGSVCKVGDETVIGVTMYPILWQIWFWLILLFMLGAGLITLAKALVGPWLGIPPGEASESMDSGSILMLIMLGGFYLIMLLIFHRDADCSRAYLEDLLRDKASLSGESADRSGIQASETMRR